MTSSGAPPLIWLIPILHVCPFRSAINWQFFLTCYSNSLELEFLEILSSRYMRKINGGPSPCISGATVVIALFIAKHWKLTKGLKIVDWLK